MHIAKNEWLKTRYAKALASFEKGWQQAKALDDPKLLRAANTFSTFFHYWQGRFREAVENYEQTVPDVDKLPVGQFPILAAITVGYCYAQIGQITQGLGMLDAIRTLCVERGDLYLASYASGNMGAVLISIRRMDEALKYLRQSDKEAKRACNDWVRINSHIMMAFAHFLMGEKKQCLLIPQRFPGAQPQGPDHGSALSLSPVAVAGHEGRTTAAGGRGVSRRRDQDQAARQESLWQGHRLPLPELFAEAFGPARGSVGEIPQGTPSAGPSDRAM